MLLHLQVMPGGCGGGEAACSVLLISPILNLKQYCASALPGSNPQTKQTKFPPLKWISCNITKYGSTLYIIGMDEVLAHYACTFEILDLHFHFQ